MSDIAIRATGLGKKYFIGARRQEPQTIGESIKGLLVSPFNYLRSSLRGPSEEETLWALQDVSFEIKRGETVAIIGRNGAGKSTLLRVLARITEPTTGQVEVFGQVASLLEIGTGFHQELTGRENVYVNGALLGLSKADINRRFDEIVDFAGVERFIDTPVKRYSKGMHVRLAFSVAVNFFAEIMLLDEVLAVGDAEFREKCIKRMMAEAKSGRTIVFVSHSLGLVRQICDHGYVLDKGLLIYQNDIDSVLEYYLSREKDAEEEEPNNSPALTGNASPDQREEIAETGDSQAGGFLKIRKIEFDKFEGKTSPTFEYDEHIILRVVVEILDPTVKPGATLALSDRAGNVVFVSHCAQESPSLGEQIVRGRYQYRIPLPPKLLKPGKYLARLKMFDINTNEAYARVDSGLSFTIVDHKTTGSLKFKYHRLAVVAPEIVWEVQKSD